MQTESTHQHLTIKKWAEEDRPREKLLKKGVNSLSNAELIAILIGSGNKDETAVELAKRILNSVDNNLHELSKKTINDLSRFKGIGQVKAISIVAAVELGRRRKASEILKREKITSTNDSIELFRSKMIDLPHEEFWAVLLNQANQIIDFYKISQGGINATVTDIKLIIKFALEKTASAIVVAHNHPSGSPTPSEADIDVTKKIKDAAAFFDILLLDHIIITTEKSYSFAENKFIL